jgi:pSer/pThr/pTyr-binding forkhead associated (FHA) protein
VLATLHQRGNGPAGSARHAVHLPEVLIGRVPGNDLVIADPSVSARHARLRLSGGVWTLADLGSVNGTSVDGTPVVRAQALAPGSEVVLGETRLVFEPSDRWEDSPGPAPTAATEVASAEEAAEETSRAPMIIGVLILLVSLVGFFIIRAG